MLIYFVVVQVLGKTTSARIIANEMNNYKGKPIEIDCATHNGVDDMRQLQEQCQTRPLDCKYKIFLMDECHLLSNAAWSSLLKILEEPPEYVIFIFCTTNPEKIMPTILSRVQRFNFHRISVKGIYDRLIYILQQENITNYNENAIQYIARLAKGGMRTAITTLQKCLDYGDLNLYNVIKVTSGGITEDILLDLTKSVINKDAVKSLHILNDVYNSGIDMQLFLKMYIEFLNNCTIFLLTNDMDMTTLSDITINWLEANKQQLDIIRSLLMNLLNIGPKYINQIDIKIILESWIISKCK